MRGTPAFTVARRSRRSPPRCRNGAGPFPLLVDEQDSIIAGHGRVLAAKQLGITEVPVVVARGWTEEQKRAYRLADNQIPLNATWDKAALRIELSNLREQAVDLELMGFAARDAIAPEGPELPQGLQLAPAREYALIMCDDLDEWERLKVALSLTPVRRGGYKKGSAFDDVGTQRVVKAADVLRLIEDKKTRRTPKPPPGRRPPEIV
jgi:hypothetical protein